MIHKDNRSDDGLRVVGMEGSPRARISRKEFLRFSALGAASIAGANVLAACVSDDQSGLASGKPPTVPTGSAAVALPGPPPSLDPTTSFSANDLPVTSNIYESLLRYDGKLAPSLATSYSLNDDATEWAFELRQGVRFHDGSELDADAVKATIEYHGRADSAVAFLVGEPTSIDVPNPRKVVVRFDEPFPEFGRYMSAVKIISPKLLDGSSADVGDRVNATPTGTGPYRFVRRENNDVVVTANDAYWGSGPYIKDVTFKVVPDESTRMSALQADDLDIVTRVPPPTAEAVEGYPGIALLSDPTLAVVQLSLATARPPFNDVRVRQALMYAIDREAILDSTYKGKGVITGSPLPPDAYGFARPTTQYGYDPERSKTLLAEAGFSTPVSFSMATFSSMMLGSTLGQAIVGMADDAGFSVDFDVVDQGVGDKDLVEGNDRTYDVFILENGFLAGSALHVNNVVFYSQYEGPLLDQISKMNSLADGPARRRAVAAVQETWAQELPCLPMWAIEFVAAVDSSIAGFEPPIDGYQPQLAPAYRPVSG